MSAVADPAPAVEPADQSGAWPLWLNLLMTVSFGLQAAHYHGLIAFIFAGACVLAGMRTGIQAERGANAQRKAQV